MQLFDLIELAVHLFEVVVEIDVKLDCRSEECNYQTEQNNGDK